MMKQFDHNSLYTYTNIMSCKVNIFSTREEFYVIKLLYLLDLTNWNLYLNTLIICLIILKIMALLLIYLGILGAFVICVVYSSHLEVGCSPAASIKHWCSVSDQALSLISLGDCFPKFGVWILRQHHQNSSWKFFFNSSVAIMILIHDMKV